jgi:hypothetical protein
LFLLFLFEKAGLIMTTSGPKNQSSLLRIAPTITQNLQMARSVVYQKKGSARIEA